LNQQSRYAEQRDLLRDGIASCEKEINMRNDLAYLLATAPDDAVRDGPRALALAKKLVRDAEEDRPDFLDTLACSFAEIGNFTRAKKESARAIAMLRSRGTADEEMSEYLDHLAQFERGEGITTALVKSLCLIWRFSMLSGVIEKRSPFPIATIASASAEAWQS
jgi:hypothetical protein